MSFSRAKIQRFNDITSCSPSPADYNPKVQACPTGASISQVDRFPEPRSPGNSDTTSVNSINSTQCFRTPTLIKKKKTVTSKTKPVNLFINPEDKETLIEKIVECNNKDVYINELTEQIEEMKFKIDRLGKQKNELENEKSNFDIQIDNVKQQHELVLENLILKHHQELKNVDCQINLIKEELRIVKKEYKELKLQNTADMASLLLNVDKFQCLYETTIEAHNIIIEDKEKRLKELENNFNQLSLAHAEEILELKNKHKEEIRCIEYEMLKNITQMQKEYENEKQNCINKIKDNEEQKLKEISDLKCTFEEEKLKLQTESEAQLKQIEENCKEASQLAEMQLQEKYKDVEFMWKKKLEDKEKESEEILKECQAISEYNIIQCEMEKNDVKHELSNAIKEIEEISAREKDIIFYKNQIETKYENLKMNFDQTIIDFSTQSEKLQLEKLDLENELQQALAEKHTYEITINKTHITIEALKKRLFDSDRDVEQLKLELDRCELSKLDEEAKCNQLKNELVLAHKIYEDLELQNETALTMTEEKIKRIKKELLEKVTQYEQIIVESVKTNNDKLEQKASELNAVMEELHCQQALNSEAQNLLKTVNLELERIEAMNTDYKFKNKCLESSLDVIQKELDKTTQQIKSLNESKADLENKLQNEINSYKKLNEMYQISKLKNNEVEFLTKQLHQLQEKSDSYYQYCEYYKSKANEYEQEIEDMNKINKNYIDQSKKYDDLLQQNEALTLKNCELEAKVALQEALIGPFREQLEDYEMEHSALLSQKCDAENEARLMGLKYAQILGHQNQKQKIKHLVDLKLKNFQLQEKMKEMDCKQRTQAKTIEKLKKELASVSQSPRKMFVNNTNKENINSPNRSVNTSHISSPLRDRN